MWFWLYWSYIEILPKLQPPKFHVCSSDFVCSKYRVTSGPHNSCLLESLHPLFCDDLWALSKRRLKKLSHLTYFTVSYSLLMDHLQNSVPINVKWSFTNDVWETHSKFLVCVRFTYLYVHYTYKELMGQYIIMCINNNNNNNNNILPACGYK